MSRTLSLGSISTRLRRIAKLSREDRKRSLTNLSHYVDEDFLRVAYSQTRKSGSAGVDDQTASEYAVDLEENLRSLVTRFHAGRYRASPVRRHWIPKARGRRPIGIPTFEDKVLQRGVAMVLGAVYEEDFLDCSSGFRPGRSAHQALATVWQGLMRMHSGLVLEVDIRSFFDDIDHGQLREFLDQRVRDGVLRRTIDKWLRAGVMEEGVWARSATGTPQGGAISPILANVYLHEVVDRWFEEVVKPRLLGEAFLVRYADDFLIVFAYAPDAHRVLRVLPKRLSRFGLELSKERARLVRFYRPVLGSEPRAGERPGSFSFLGFTHYWGRARDGSWVVKRKTASDRMSRSLRSMNEWCRRHHGGETSWALWVLRDHRQRSFPPVLCLPSATPLASLVGPSVAEGTDELEQV